MKYYTGIGSRSTPQDVLALFEAVAAKLSQVDDWVLRSGAAPGADSAFERGAIAAQIFLPWNGFEGRYEGQNGAARYFAGPTPSAFDIAEQFHPAWDRCKQGAQKLHARNVHQVLGFTPSSPVLSRFVLCWTPGGSGSGGTGQALRIAKHYGVPIIDAGSPAGRARVEAFLSGPRSS